MFVCRLPCLSYGNKHVLHRDLSTFDEFSIPHILVGAAMAALGFSRTAAYSIILGTEVVEAALRGSGFDFFDETPSNITADIVLGILGYEAIKIWG